MYSDRNVTSGPLVVILE